jgi:hypothetical protein
MSSKKTLSDINRQTEIIAEAHRYRDQREKTYRAQALKAISKTRFSSFFRLTSLAYSA